MASLKILVVLLLAQYVVSDNPAERSVDPLIVPLIEVNVPNDDGIVIYLKNLNITGLDKRELLDHKIDTDAKTVYLKVKSKLQAVGEVEFAVTKLSKKYSGGYSLVTDFIEKINYDYDVKDDDKGVPRVQFQNVKLTHESYGEPKVEIGADFATAYKNDIPDHDMDTKIEVIRAIGNALIWKIADTAFSNLIDSYVDIAKTLPATGFFEDLEKRRF